MAKIGRPQTRISSGYLRAAQAIREISGKYGIGYPDEGGKAWNAYRYAQFQSFFRAHPGYGKRDDLDYTILMRTTPVTPWHIELFLKYLERESVTVGIHREDSARKKVTPVWRFQFMGWKNRPSAKWQPDEFEDMPNWDLGESDTNSKEPWETWGSDEGMTSVPWNLERQVDSREFKYIINAWELKMTTPITNDPYYLLKKPKITSASRSNAALGYLLEKGDPVKGIAPRNWLHGTIEENIYEINKMISAKMEKLFYNVLDVGQLGPWTVVGGRGYLYSTPGVMETTRSSSYGKYNYRTGELITRVPNLWYGFRMNEPMTVGREWPADNKYSFGRGTLDEQSKDMYQTLRRFRYLLVPVFHIIVGRVKKALIAKSPENKPFTKDYKREGGRDTRGNTITDFSHFSGDNLPYMYGGEWASSTSKGIFTGQLLNSIKYKWDESHRIENERNG